MVGSSPVGSRLALLIALCFRISIPAAAFASPMTPETHAGRSIMDISTMVTVNTTEQLRDELRRPNAKGHVALHLLEGHVYRLNGTQLHIDGIHASLHSDGVGATLDAEGKSLHWDVARGGQIHLHRVHTRGGMLGLTHDHMTSGAGHA